MSVSEHVRAAVARLRGASEGRRGDGWRTQWVAAAVGEARLKPRSTLDWTVFGPGLVQLAGCILGWEGVDPGRAEIQIVKKTPPHGVIRNKATRTSDQRRGGLASIYLLGEVVGASSRRISD